MTELFNGGEMDAFSPSDSNVEESTTTSASAPRFDSTFCRCALKVGNTGGSDATYAETAHWTAVGEGYLRFDLYLGSLGSITNTIVSLMTDAGLAAVRLRSDNYDTSTHTVILQYWNGASYTDAGSVILPLGLQTFDLHWNLDASGELDFYVAGTPRITFTGDLSALADIGYARLHSTYIPTYWSQVMADTDSTIGHRLMTCPPTGAGATTNWTTGTYTEIDEIVYSDADFLSSATADQVTTVAQTATGALTGYVAQSVTVSARANRDASGPQNIRLALRASGTDYFSAGDKALAVGYGPFQTIWETNPATAAAWVNAAISAIQPGVKSIT